MGQRRRQTGIILIVVVLVIVILAGGAVVVFSLLGGGGDETADGETPDSETDGAEADVTPTAIPPTATPVPTLYVIVAERDIRRGAIVTVDDLGAILWAGAEDTIPPNGYAFNSVDTPEITELTSNLELEEILNEIVGSRAISDFVAGQPLQQNLLTRGDEPTQSLGSPASTLIPSGFVAVAVPVNRFGLVGYALRPLDHVDILASYMLVDVNEQFQTLTPSQQLSLTEDANGNISANPLGARGIFVDPPVNRGDFSPRAEIPGPGEDEFLGDSILIVPSEAFQRPRVATQLLIDNAIVLRVGAFDLEELFEPIVITEEVEVQAEEAVGEGEEGEGAAEGEEPAPPPPPEPADDATPIPTPTPVPPDLVILMMPRQDALVLKYSIETGSLIDLVLRSALDDDVDGIATDTVTLSYILNNYNVEIPPRLHVAQEPRVDVIYNDFLVFDLLNILDVQAEDTDIVIEQP
ncbi:MAG: hypothetical protein GYB68_05775 [Chloroflexi bacterium]|nr:hypothetical protein [Chloroflexota bacterium]